MYLQHIWGVMLLLNFLMPSFSSGMLVLVHQEILHEAPHSSIGFNSGLSARFFHQLILLFLYKALNVSTGMLTPLSSYSLIMIRPPKQWNKGSKKNVTICCCCQVSPNMTSYVAAVFETLESRLMAFSPTAVIVSIPVHPLVFIEIARIIPS